METDDLWVGSNVNSGGGGSSSVASSESEMTDVELQFSLDGEELFSTHISDAQLAGAFSSDSTTGGTF